MQIHASAEDYLEKIFLLSGKPGGVRSKNIVEEMGFSKPSVSVAMKKLRENDLIRMDEDGYITLTSDGSALAQHVYERHSTLYNWLLSIGVGEETAASDACKMEHIISEETFERIKELV